MNDPVLYTGGGISRRSERAISRHHEETRLAVSAMDAKADRAVAAMDEVTYAIGHAARQIHAVGEGVRSIEMLNPALSGRLQALADLHGLAMIDLVSELQTQLRRLV